MARLRNSLKLMRAAYPDAERDMHNQAPFGTASHITAGLRMPQAVSNRPPLPKAVYNRNKGVDQTSHIIFGICAISSLQSAEAELRGTVRRTGLLDLVRHHRRPVTRESYLEPAYNGRADEGVERGRGNEPFRPSCGS